MGVFAKPAIAIAFGAFMFCAETCLHSEDLLNAAAAPPRLPLLRLDTAGFLLVAGVLQQSRLD